MIDLGEKYLLIPNYYLGVKKIPVEQIYSIENIKLKNKNVAIVLGLKNKGRYFIDKFCFMDPGDFDVFKSNIKLKISLNYQDGGQDSITSISQLQESKFLIATISICLICIFFFAIGALSLPDESSRNEYLLLGAGSKSFFEQGEFYRLFSSSFFHVNIFHLMLNLLVLAIMGELIEKVISTFRYINIFFLSCVLSYGSFLVFSSYEFGIGASGGVFGLWGAYFALKMRYEKYLPGSVNAIPLNRLAWILIMEFFIEIFLLDNVGVEVHLGGFLAGFTYLYLAPLGDKLETVDQPTLFEKGLCATLVSAYTLGLSYFLLLYYGVI